MNKFWWVVIISLGLVVGGGIVFWQLRLGNLGQGNELLSGFVKEEAKEKERPLQKYALSNLHNLELVGSQVRVDQELETADGFVSWQFWFMTGGKKMSGQINWPVDEDGQLLPVSQVKGLVVMVRGWVPEESYQTGDGTRPAATVLANNDLVTVAPDFLGVAASDTDLDDPWEARFIKPIQVAELIKSIQEYPLVVSSEVSPSLPNNSLAWQNLPIGIWAHSNGGQIALTTLMTLQQPLPTTLWAPVTAPFPYSILFFSDESADEGKATRKWLSLFEDDYDAFDFSLTKNLDQLPGGPIQLHHGSADEAALQVWSDEFAAKVELENERRAEVEEQIATGAATLTELANSNPALLQPIDLTYYKYPAADHNLRPVWNTVVNRDVEFFQTTLMQPK